MIGLAVAGGLAIGAAISGLFSKRGGGGDNGEAARLQAEQFRRMNEEQLRRQKEETARRDMENKAFLQTMQKDRDVFMSAMANKQAQTNSTNAIFQEKLATKPVEVPSFDKEKAAFEALVSSNRNFQTKENLFEVKNKKNGGKGSTQLINRSAYEEEEEPVNRLRPRISFGIRAK